MASTKKPKIPMNVRTSIEFTKFFNTTWREATAITDEITKAVRNAAKKAGKTLDAVALADWRRPLQRAVYKQLLNGGNWSADRTKVLTVAADMGTIAALLSGRHRRAGENQLRAAFTATKSHATCSSGGVGGGDWCTFSWI